MIYDCFLFNNEWDILDIRFEELYPVVDKFVMLESNLTFSGKPKHFNMPQYIERYAPYRDKMVILFLAGDDRTDAWTRESNSRNALRHGLNEAQPEDIIILSDVDEIPRRSIVENLGGRPVSLVMDKFQYSLNALTHEKHGATKAFHYNFLEDKTMHEIRKMDLLRIENAGWEFSSFGTPEQIQSKLQSFAHTEFDVPGISDLDSIMRRIANREDVVGRPDVLTIVPVDDTWPEAVKRDPERWKDYVWPT